jgi:carbon monoxide dehydrogenase subunit G
MKRYIQAPPQRVWEVLDDFGEIQRWSPGVKRSRLTSQLPIAMGSTRHCDFTPLGSAQERIEVYEPGVRMTVRLYDIVMMPLADATADFHLSTRHGGTELTFRYAYELNRLGRLFDRALSGQLQKGLEGLVGGLQRESEQRAGGP